MSIETISWKSCVLVVSSVSASTQRSGLVFANDVIMSETGTQQGNSFGPVRFPLAIDGITNQPLNPLTAWFLDDAPIGGCPSRVNNDVVHTIPALSRIVPDIIKLNMRLSSSSVTPLMSWFQTYSTSSQWPRSVRLMT